MAQFDITMTYRLDSDVPVPYPSWAEYNFMDAPRNKVTFALSCVVVCVRVCVSACAYACILVLYGTSVSLHNCVCVCLYAHQTDEAVAVAVISNAAPTTSATSGYRS